MLFKLAGIWLEGFGEPARLGIAGLGAFAISLAGTRNALPEPLDKLAPALLLVMTLDFVFGVIVAIIGRKFCWPGLLKGLVKMIAYGGGILVCVALDMALPSVLPNIKGPMFTVWGLAFFIIVDAISVLNHLRVLGAPMPSGMSKILERAKKGLDEACPAGQAEEK